MTFPHTAARHRNWNHRAPTTCALTRAPIVRRLPKRHESAWCATQRYSQHEGYFRAPRFQQQGWQQSRMPGGMSDASMSLLDLSERAAAWSGVAAARSGDCERC